MILNFLYTFNSNKTNSFPQFIIITRFRHNIKYFLSNSSTTGNFKKQTKPKKWPFET